MTSRAETPTTWPLDLPDPAAVLPAIEEAGVRSVVWKDLYELEAFAQGDGELDLLVHPDDLDAFRAVAQRHGYAEFRHHLDIYEGAISHWLRFAKGRHFHLHVHTRLLTGDHTAKEYDLGPLLDLPGDAIFEGPLVGGVRVVAAETELAIGLVRLILKSAGGRGVKLEELERLRSLDSPDRFKRALERIARRVRLSERDVAALHAVLEGDDAQIRDLAAFAPCFDDLRRLGRAGTFVARWRLRIADALAAREGLANKVLVEVAPTLAIIGPDGSGKSTICDALEAALRKKVSVARIYLGSNAQTYRLGTRLAYGLAGLLGRVQKRLPNTFLLKHAHTLALALLEHEKCRDRVLGIRRGRRLAARGIVVIFERYPVANLYDYPPLASAVASGEHTLAGLLARPVRRLLAAIDRRLERAGPPDLMLLCTLDFDRIASRRALGPAERVDIRQKLALLDRFDPASTPNLHVMHNDGPLTATLAEVFDRVNRELCSRSS